MSDININDIITNPGAERIILSNCMIDTNTIIDCETEGLLPKHFAIFGNKVIYNAIMYLFTSNQTVDAMSILNVIKDTKAREEIDRLGGLEYLMLLQQSPKTLNISMFCQEVIACYVRREVYDVCKDIQVDVIKNNEKDSDIILSTVNQRIMDLTLSHSKITDSYKMGDSIDERLKRFADNPVEVPGLATGWRRFDKATSGAIAGDLIIVCAEAKTGKSVTLLNWAKNIAIDQQLPILWIDSEQSNEEEELRLISNISQVPEHEIKTGFYTQDTMYGTAQEKITKLNYAKRLLKDSNFHHIYLPDFTLEKIGAIARKFHLKHGIVALFFDYVKLNPVMMSQHKTLRTDLMLTTLTSGLKNLAGTLKIPIFTAAQETRSGYGSQEKDAKNIGESIGILQLATKLMFLRNLSDEEIAVRTDNANQELIISYMRHGESGLKIPIQYKKYTLTQVEAQ